MSEQTDTTTLPPTPEPVPEPVPEPAPEAMEVPEPPAPGPKRSRRVLWAAARWTAAVVVCGGLGVGTAAGITSMERTDVPGLATEHDGRWEYPKLSLPPLPHSSQRPFSPGNEGEIHHADLRALLLPAPVGATVDPKLNGGWVSLDRFLSLYRQDDRPALKEALADSALRHVAARGWTTPDGTTTRIHLLRFNSVAFAEAFKDDGLKAGSVDGALLDGVEGIDMESSLATRVEVPYTALYSFVEEPAGAEQSRWAYVQAGDTIALVAQSRKGGALLVPFQQTVTLQNQLLG
ncbi:hypothetical protein [Streptomyces lateritius]|uniref:hypothetical protein n=1 Tax=Streptomyces lateritius TaxID=67313 RepID=UPI001673AD7A|nr:hypothetical protein [Streptomyces lateritius]GGU03984.1 hypothetical protein GCM10010272_56490 [Streptomyces lateritius]